MLHNPTGHYIDIQGERFYCIENYNHMQPFFISLASDTDLWMYISSTGGLTCGRRNPEQVLFPYYTDDKITENYEQTGPKTILRVQTAQGTKLWEPFSSRQMGTYHIIRSIAKSVTGNRLLFREENVDLGLIFSYEWAPATHLGWVRTACLSNDTDAPITVEVLDGLQNVMPSGVERITQNTFSTLVDGYKRTEHVGNGMVLFRMEAILVDRAEPSESLRCNSIYTLGLDNAQYLCSSAQLDAFRMGMAIQPETESKGVRGSIFAHFTLTLSPLTSSPNSLQWHLVCDVMQDAVSVRRNMAFMQQANAIEQLQAALQTTTNNLRQIVAQNDGVQHTADEANDARHFANTLFNTMRGGFYCNSYQISGPAFAAHVALFNRALADKHHTFLSDLPESISYAELDQAVQDRQDHQLHRLFMEYLPLTFSRRHGDPSRPWNLFDIRVKDEQDRHIISYQGNWRDIFQNWEALSLSYPDFTNSIIAKFLNATTADGYNPYKVTSEGIDWEVIEPENPWSNIGYWGDHQIIYLCRLLELSHQHNPQALRDMLGMREFAFAAVPYRFRSYADIVRDPKNTITFDQAAHDHIFSQLSTYGQDARLVMGTDNQPLLVTFTEKLLITLLTKLSNFIPEAGIWMNTLRPEWNDANNALVGNGASMVTLYYMRRFVAFLIDLYSSDNCQLTTVNCQLSTANTYALSEEVVLFLRNILTAMVNHLPEQADQPISFTDHTRRTFTDQVGRAGEAYRNAIYAGHSGKKVEMDASLICQFLNMTLDFIDQSIDVNQREDGLYHAYNLVKFDRGTITISHLYEMLEGQVAVLSSRRLDAEQAAHLLDAMRQSALYREDQRSYMLYPARKRASFLDMNTLPEEALSLPIVQRLLANKVTDILTQDCIGKVHFSANFNNADFLLRAIQCSSEQITPEETEQLLNLYEQLFNHHAFTGRSGTFYKYEGLGCIYWHMVSKLLLAVGESISNSVSDLTAKGGPTSDSVAVSSLIAHYKAIREGIGSHKTPAEYGSFPFDAYSHTPSYGVPENARGVLGCHAGVQQPGMTGQVKEDIISRFFELGVHVQDGQITFCPIMLTDADFRDGELRFSYCGTEIIYRKTGNGTGSVTLSPEQSQHIFARDGEIKQLIVEL
ncbi:MAG: hypothetical protein II267_03600 [Paludibacteraceae bacterium]|nr:hypothetical protein [Paludibacteraceae bacterium]